MSHNPLTKKAIRVFAIIGVVLTFMLAGGAPSDHGIAGFNPIALIQQIGQ